VDNTDEVTRFFDPHTQHDEAMTRIFTEADVVGYDGLSDYGTALRRCPRPAAAAAAAGGAGRRAGRNNGAP
uniref:hypothetical protein n=1 Tax=Nocardia farcinica TaxID=37329 RepID=UPI00245653F3